MRSCPPWPGRTGVALGIRLALVCEATRAPAACACFLLLAVGCVGLVALACGVTSAVHGLVAQPLQHAAPGSSRCILRCRRAVLEAALPAHVTRGSRSERGHVRLP